MCTPAPALAVLSASAWTCCPLSLWPLASPSVGLQPKLYFAKRSVSVVPLGIWLREVCMILRHTGDHSRKCIPCRQWGHHTEWEPEESPKLRPVNTASHSITRCELEIARVKAEPGAQLVEHSPSMHGALGSSPACMKGVVTHHLTLEVSAGRLDTHGRPWLYFEFEVSLSYMRLSQNKHKTKNTCAYVKKIFKKE